MSRVGSTNESRTVGTILAVAVILAIRTMAQSADSASSETSTRTVVVSIPDRKLAVVVDGDVISQFPIAVGAAESPSPTGKFRIINRVTNPTYYHPGSVVPAGKDNPVGTRAI